MARAREGLGVRHGGSSSDQVQIHIGKFDFDAEVDAMRASVSQIKKIAKGIEEERVQQGELIDSLAEVMDRARLNLKQTMGRLNKAYKQAQSNHMLMLVIFAIMLFVGVYVLAKIYRLGKHVLG